MNTQDFINKARQVHGEKYDYSKVQYVGVGDKVDIICPNHSEKPVKKTPMQIHEEATEAAQNATEEFIAKHGEPFYCGFAWVNINNGRSGFARALSKAGVAKKSYDKGVDVWNPSNCRTQSMDVLEAGARAYAEVLRKNGVEAFARSRPD